LEERKASVDPVAVSSSALRTIERGKEGLEANKSSNNSKLAALRRSSGTKQQHV
jgi:hypothetical protein